MATYEPSRGKSRKKRKLDDDVQRLEKISRSDVICPICFDMFNEVQVTTCGHSFCHDCIRRCLTQSAECPVCKANISAGFVSHFVPNFSLNDIVVKLKSYESQEPQMQHNVADFIRAMDSLPTSSYETLRLHLDKRILDSKKVDLEIDRKIKIKFLRETKRRKEQEFEKIQNELKIVDKDIQEFSDHSEDDSEDCTVPVYNAFPDNAQEKYVQKSLQLDSHFDDLQQTYFDLSSNSQPLSSSIPMSDSEATSSTGSVNSIGSCEPLMDEFNKTLQSVTKYSSFKELATLHYADGPVGTNSIVSSIEFDKDGDLFAVGGVTKKVKIFSYSSVTSNQHNFTPIHYPVRELPCRAKISSVAYNPYMKPQLATSDYDGTLSIWDTNFVKCIQNYQEHEKRVWSVTYNQYDSSLLATGGDDCSLRLWHLTSSHSIQCQPTRANVCSVRFQPGNRYYLAYGSADHMIRLVDIRKFTEPIMCLKGHKKAVSYVHYLNDNHLVSASTDSELKLWSVDTGTCVKTYRGHVNDKNFVGLTVNDDFITCGSEDNSFYVYNKSSSKPLLKYKFRVSKNILPTGISDQVIDDGSDFVSAVCSRKGHNSNGIVAANSQGFIKVLEMI